MNQAPTKVRTRFAPSPTGYMHIGNLRTALYTFLIARHYDGTFILRIEDTDQERYIEDSVTAILRTMKEVGLTYEEGPGVGGPVGPYVQSERRAIYRKWADVLIERGGAYRCFCTKERLDGLRAELKKGQVFQYDRHCRHLGAADIKGKLAAGMAHVVRQAIPTSGETTIRDEVYGEIVTQNTQLEDGVLLKTDGLPTYNFANVVDDHLMGITHVVRGNEYLSSAPKYNLIYESFGWEIPAYVHVPQIMRDASRKLSKRDGDASFEDFRAKGYLSEAIVNYVALLGWSPGNDVELFTMPELIKAFTVGGLSKSPAIFDPKKLRWMNGVYIHKLSPEAFHALAAPYYAGLGLRSGIDLTKLSRMIQPRVEVLSEIPAMLGFLRDLPDYSIELFTNPKMKTDPAGSLTALKALRERLAPHEGWEVTALDAIGKDVIAARGVKASQVLFPLRTALTGLPASPGGGLEVAELLGKDESLRRIDVALKKLAAAVPS